MLSTPSGPLLRSRLCSLLCPPQRDMNTQACTVRLDVVDDLRVPSPPYLLLSLHITCQDITGPAMYALVFHPSLQ